MNLGTEAAAVATLEVQVETAASQAARATPAVMAEDLEAAEAAMVGRTVVAERAILALPPKPHRDFFERPGRSPDNGKAPDCSPSSRIRSSRGRSRHRV